MAVNLTKLRGMSPEELDREARELRDEIWKLRLQRSTGQLQDPSKIRRTRHDLARVLTVRRGQQAAKTASR
jgi:large subunit ribosomal protein L29